MLVIGLTGSIGTGKSEAASYMAQLGATVINADQVGHEAYTPHSEGWNRVVEAFGEGILGADGEIDRRALGAIVFSQPEQLAKLNKIMHPLIARMVADKIEGLRSRKAEVVVVEAALLFEAGWEFLVQEVWSTDSPEQAVIQAPVGTQRLGRRGSAKTDFLPDGPQRTLGTVGLHYRQLGRNRGDAPGH